MTKARVWMAAWATGMAAVLGLVACEDDTGSTFEDTPEDAGPLDTGPVFETDGGSSDANVPVTCDPVLPAGFAPTWTPPVPSAACTADALGAYFDACLGNLGQPDAEQTCTAWLAANEACGTCIEPDDGSGPVQWHRERAYYTLNVAGCLSLLRNETAAEQCPATYNASIQCQRESCGGCLLQTSAQFQDFQNCQAEAKAGDCATYESAFSAACGTTFNDEDGGAYGCFRASGEDARTHFVRVEGYFCNAD